MEKHFTKKHKYGILSLKEQELRERSYSGKIILECNCYQGGVTCIQEFQKVETNIE